MKRRLAKAVLMSLVCASVVPKIGEANDILNVNSPGEYKFIGGVFDGYDTINIDSDGEVKISCEKPNTTYTDFPTVSFGAINEIGINISSKSNVTLDGYHLHLVNRPSADGSQIGIKNNGNLTINNELTLGFDMHGIVNDGNMILNNFINDWTSSTQYEITNNGMLKILDGGTDGEIINNGSLIIEGNGLDSYVRLWEVNNYAEMSVKDTSFTSTYLFNNGTITMVNNKEIQLDNDIENNGSLIIKDNESVSIYFNTFKHGTNAITEIVLGGNNTESRIAGQILGSNNGSFRLVLKENSEFWAGNNTEIVSGIELDGGTLQLSYNDYENWYDDFNTLRVDNLKSSGILKGGIVVATDLINNVGDKIKFFGTTPNATIPLLIINKNDNNGIPVTRENKHSVTVAEAPANTGMKFDASLGFYETTGNSVKVYQPIVDEVMGVDNDAHSVKRWNFVGWEEGQDERPKDKAKQEQIEHSILVEDVEPIFKRFNDLRTDPSEIGVWVRGETGETKIRNLSYDHNIMSGGYDWDYKNDAGVLFAGVGFTYSTNECDDKAIGDTKGYGFNAYGSWLGKKNNDYVDLVVKYGKLDKSYAGYDENNIFVAGDYDKDLFTIAAKYGRRIFKDDWYYEPSVGLTWGRVGSADFTDNHGTRIHADNSYSNIASLGIQVGKNIKGIEYYGKAEVMHDFDGKIHVSAPGRSVEDDMGGTWVKCAIGASRKIDENNSFYLEVERDFGNKVEKPYGVSLGYRFTW